MASEINIVNKDLRDIHFDTLESKSSLQFIDDEVLFINQLLHSYVFEPTTPNLFERLQEFKQEINNVKKEIEELNEEIRKHESELGGMLECDTISCDHYYYEEHKSLKNRFNAFYRNFRKLKSEVFSYAGGILKNNKK
ncbi:hypothetical protein [uncultured Aquimarina sp.]|uniref:hypothetical protein n=1 Tax=uncultured Aquimarina sp. TaxID=575652 RepID=UPI00262C7FB5|nr:hypothetical protein [uncultured Aquimarina sp.]